MEMSEAGDELVIYEQDGVLLTTKGLTESGSNLFLGRLRISREGDRTFLGWVGEDAHTTMFCGSNEPDWTVINANQGVSYNYNVSGKPVRFEVEDLKCIHLSSIADNSSGKPKRHASRTDTEHTCSVSFVLADGTTYPHLIFPGGSTTGLLDALKHHLQLKRSRKDDSLILCEPKETRRGRDPYTKTLAELRLFPDRNPSGLGYINLGQLGQIGQGAWRFVNDLKRDPYATTLTAFSKISDYLLHEDERPSEDIAELLQKSLTVEEEPAKNGRTIPQVKESEDSAAALVGSSDSSVEGYELIQPPVADLIPMPQVNRGEPLTEIEWLSHFDDEGRISCVHELKAKVFSGGVDHKIRCDVWKYLLGYYPWHMTHAERKDYRDGKVEDYYRMKLQWRSLSSEQESRFAALKQRKDLIEKDVNRTDRTVAYYSGENNDHVSTLRDVLMTYMMFDFDLGYVQGMSDLLAPILYVMDNEVDSFWCFVAYMQRVSLNFELDQGGIKRQLNQLRTLLHAYDPHLATYLDSRDSGNLFFCFRWLLVLFKREFSYSDILKLWEILWTDGPFWRASGQDNQLQQSSSFHLLIAISILDKQRNTILENRFGFTEILKHTNDLALYIELEETVAKAEGIFYQMKGSPSVGLEVRRILGIDAPSTESDETFPSRSTSCEFPL